MKNDHFFPFKLVLNMQFDTVITRVSGEIFLLSIMFLVLNQHIPTADSPDNEGKEFILAFSDNFHYGQPLNDKLYITTSKQHHVGVKVFCPRLENSILEEHFTVIAGNVHVVDVPASLTVVGTEISSKGIHIIADDEIIVYGVNIEAYSMDAFLCLPIDVLGQNYYVLSYTVAIENRNSNDFSQILIVGIENQTQISIKVPDGTSIDFDLDNLVGINQTSPFTINSFETFQIQSKSDLTGICIKSSKPIVVYSGNKKTRVGYDTGSLDHICQQLLPVETWGTEFVIVTTPERSDIVRIMASEDDTVVMKKLDNITTIIYLNSSGSYSEIEIESNKYVYFKSDKPILVAQYVKSGDSSDPSMIIVPAVHQFTAIHTFSTLDRDMSFQHYFMFVTKKDQQGTFLINGVHLNTDGYVAHEVTGTDFIGGYIKLPEGTYRIAQSTPVNLFSGILYGAKNFESFALPTGLRLPRMNIVCNKTVSVEGDGIDNDCDGLIDEDICTDSDKVRDDEDEMHETDCARPLPVDGSWSTWGAWSTCSIVCSSSTEVKNGIQSRSRSCSDPKPMYDGFPCKGLERENRDCEAKCSDIPRSCRCPCRKAIGKWNHLLDQNLSTEQLRQSLTEEIEKLRMEVLVDKKTTVQYFSTKKSNDQDQRQSSKGLSVAILVFMSIPFALIILSDLHRFYVYFNNR